MCALMMLMIASWIEHSRKKKVSLDMSYKRGLCFAAAGYLSKVLYHTVLNAHDRYQPIFLI